jgi:hypothetical protein
MITPVLRYPEGSHAEVLPIALGHPHRPEWTEGPSFLRRTGPSHPAPHPPILLRTLGFLGKRSASVLRIKSSPESNTNSIRTSFGLGLLLRCRARLP